MDFIQNNWKIIAEMIGGIVIFFAGRKSKKQSEKTDELENIKIVRQIEKDLLDDMREEIKELITIKNELEAVNKSLRCLLHGYEKKYGKLNKENE